MARRPELSQAFPSSTRVKRAWYDPGTRKVTAQFPDGTRWAYYDVDEKTWGEFIRAPSAGKFLNSVLQRHKNGPAGR
jgi:hypothetical protein